VARRPCSTRASSECEPRGVSRNPTVRARAAMACAMRTGGLVVAGASTAVVAASLRGGNAPHPASASAAAASSEGCSVEAASSPTPCRSSRRSAPTSAASRGTISARCRSSRPGLPEQVPGGFDPAQAIMKSFDAVMRMRAEYANRVYYVIAPGGRVPLREPEPDPARGKTLGALKDCRPGDEARRAIVPDHAHIDRASSSGRRAAAGLGAQCSDTQARSVASPWARRDGRIMTPPPAW